MARKLPSIPKPSANVPKVIADILNPIREAIETRFIGSGSTELAVTRSDLVKLGLVSTDELNKLDT